MTNLRGDPTKLPNDGAKLLSEFTLALVALDAILPDRVTIRQVIFFTAIARSLMRGETVTQQNIFDEFEGTIGRSLTKSGALFFTPSRTYPNALGWLEANENPDDRREKIITFTHKGRDAICIIINNIRRLKG